MVGVYRGHLVDLEGQACYAVAQVVGLLCRLAGLQLLRLQAVMGWWRERPFLMRTLCFFGPNLETCIGFIHPTQNIGALRLWIYHLFLDR